MPTPCPVAPHCATVNYVCCAAHNHLESPERKSRMEDTLKNAVAASKQADKAVAEQKRYIDRMLAEMRASYTAPS